MNDMISREAAENCIKRYGKRFIDEGTLTDSDAITDMINAIDGIGREQPKMRVMLEKNAYMPTRAHEADAGFDLYAPDGGLVPCGKTYIVKTGVHVEIPRGYCGLVKSRSGLHMEYGITTTGVVDAGYTGEIAVKLSSHENTALCFSRGDRIAQLVIVPVYTPELIQVENLKETDRGNNGFGSSGR